MLGPLCLADYIFMDYALFNFTFCKKVSHHLQVYIKIDEKKELTASLCM